MNNKIDGDSNEIIMEDYDKDENMEHSNWL
jgi:hypothetical protein